MKWLALIVLVLAGCTIHDGNVDHHLIIGFGVVSVARTNSVGMTAVKVQALGLHVSGAPGPKVTVGYLDNILVQVPDGASNVVVETRAGFGRFKVSTQ